MVKRLRKLVQYIRIYSTKYAEPRREHATQFRLGYSPPKLLDRSSTKFYTYSGISGAIKSCIYTALSHSVSECQSDESAWFAIFLHKIGCNGNVPWDIEKRYPDRSSAPKTLSFGEKITKIGPGDPEIICLREIIKKMMKKKKQRKKLAQAKYIASRQLSWAG